MAGRDRPDTQEALDRIKGAFDVDREKLPVIKRLMRFQVFASAMLMLVAVLSIVSLGLALQSESDARQRAEQRVETFEVQINTVLDSIDEAQTEANSQREDIKDLLKQIEGELQGEL